MTDTFFLIVGIVLAILGGLIFAAAVSNTRSCSKKTTARVIRIEWDNTRHWKGSYPHYPVVAYTIDGKEYKVKSSTYTRSSSKYKVGQEVVISYNPKNPETIQVGIGLPSYLVGACLLVCGGILVGIYLAYCL